VKAEGMTTYRSITVDGKEIEFSGGFTDLHTVSYREVLAGRGFQLRDARQSIELTHDIRNSEAIGAHGEYHPFLNGDTGALG
jgi:UDP-N-acetyl-2-amino-2-deoxyglucuronate dehydrogenase